ncbi:MAG: DegT/DnrJ/EryC1/StrS family aminotransferase [Alphaproteobacteria bacterium]
MNKTNTVAFIDLKTQLETIRPNIDGAIKKVLDHGHFIMGPEVVEFEKDLSAFTHMPHVISCSNGTDAITIALMALDVGPGDAVFVPSFTFISTAEVVALRGATPVFVDIDLRTYTMCPISLERSIHHAKKLGLNLKGIISVDLFGQPSDHDKINELAKAHKLWTIVDGAQSFGATYKGKSTFAYGLIGTTSFFPAKPLGGYGDGGAIFTQDSELADAMKSIRLHGQGKVRYETSRLGLTGRIDTLQAAILIEKLKIFAHEMKLRNKVAAHYSAALKDVATVPFVPEHGGSVWAQYTLRITNRDHVRDHLNQQGIPAVVYYPHPLHTQAPYREFPRDPEGLKVTDHCAKEVISLPMHPYLTEDVQNRIIEGVRGAV